MYKDKPVGLELSGCSGQFGSGLTLLLVHSTVSNKSSGKEIHCHNMKLNKIKIKQNKTK
jgi:hypothetical protein